MSLVWADLTYMLDQLTLVNQQIREARSKERTVRFYKLTKNNEHVADVIELNAGCIIVKYLGNNKIIQIYPTIFSFTDHIGDNFILALSDVSEKNQNANDRQNRRNTPLTKTERKVLRSMRNGLSNKEISAELSIATSTVKNVLSGVYRKLGKDVRSRVEAVRIVSDWNLDDNQDDI